MQSVQAIMVGTSGHFRVVSGNAVWTGERQVSHLNVYHNEPPLVIICCLTTVSGFVVARPTPLELSSLERSGTLDQRHRSAAFRTFGVPSLGGAQWTMMRGGGQRQGGDREYVLSWQGKVSTELKGYQWMNESCLACSIAEASKRLRLKCASRGSRVQCSFRPLRVLELPALPCRSARLRPPPF